MASATSSPSPTAVSAKPRQRRLRFRLRTLIIGVTLVSFSLAGLALWRERARRQADWVRQVVSAGGTVWYDYHYVEQPDGIHGLDTRKKSPYPEILVSWVGVDFLHSPRGLMTTPEPPGVRDRFDRELLREALSSSQQWYVLQICSLTLQTDDLKQVASQRQLEFLSLDSLLLPEQDLSPLANLKSLRCLSCQRTSLSQCDLGPLSELARLETLLIDDCQVSATQLQPLERLVGLKHISVCYNQTGSDYAWLSSLVNLEALTLVETDFRDSDLVFLDPMKHLRTLDLSKSPFTGRDIDSERLPKTIRRLHISDCPLATWEWIVGLPNLKTLIADGTADAAGGLETASWPTTLETIGLADVPISSVALNRFAVLPSLKHLSVTGKMLDQKALSSFRSGGTNVRIHMK